MPPKNKKGRKGKGKSKPDEEQQPARMPATDPQPSSRRRETRNRQPSPLSENENDTDERSSDGQPTPPTNQRDLARYMDKCPRQEERESIDDFFVRFDLYCNTYNIPEAHRRAMLPTRLGADAFATIRPLVQTNSLSPTLEGLKNQLLDRLGTRYSEAEAMQLLAAGITQGQQRIATFADHILLLVNAAFPHSDEATRQRQATFHFARGLADQRIREMAAAYASQDTVYSFRDIVSLAQKKERSLSSLGTPPRWQQPPPLWQNAPAQGATNYIGPPAPPSVPLEQMQQHLLAAVQATAKAMVQEFASTLQLQGQHQHSNSAPASRDASHDRTNYRSRSKCYQCGQPGHYQDNCPNGQQQPPPRGLGQSAPTK